jgi:hypothetical protein
MCRTLRLPVADRFFPEVWIPGAVQETRLQAKLAGGAAGLLQKAAQQNQAGPRFGLGQNRGEALRFFCPNDIGGEFDLLEQDVAVEEEDGAEGLVSPAPTAGAVCVEAATFRSAARWMMNA